MTRHVLGGLQAAAAVLLACGVLIGAVPVTPTGSGCPAPLSTVGYEGSGFVELDVLCAQERSERQLGTAAVLTLGGALLAGASWVRRGLALERAGSQPTG